MTPRGVGRAQQMSSFGRRTHREKVVLNVYDLSPSAQNDALVLLGLGAFHSGVEVHGVEWTFGSGGSGIFSHAPKGAPNVPLRSSIVLGETQASAREVEAVVAGMRPEWPGRKYSLIACNCNHFADDLVVRLIGVRVPGACSLGRGRRCACGSGVARHGCAS